MGRLEYEVNELGISQQTIDEILAKCARRCSICRRFRPLHLQVHHVIEKAQGGSDDPDNLLPICLSCHTDVHSTVPFTRRFSVNELKMHRNQLYQLVASGRIPDDSSSRVQSPVAQSKPSGLTAQDAYPLDQEAVFILQTVASSKSGGLIMVETNVGLAAKTESAVLLDPQDGPRAVASFRHSLGQLRAAGLMELRSDSYAQMTHAGYAVADDIESGNVTPDWLMGDKQ